MEIIFFIINILIDVMRLALEAVIRANHLVEADQRNMELHNLGSKLIIMGAISAAAMILALIQLPEKHIAFPFYLHIILLVILVSGLTSITFGMFFLAMNNPMRYRNLAMVMLWISFMAAAFAIGILVASSSPS